MATQTVDERVKLLFNEIGGLAVTAEEVLNSGKVTAHTDAVARLLQHIGYLSDGGIGIVGGAQIRGGAAEWLSPCVDLSGAKRTDG